MSAIPAGFGVSPEASFMPSLPLKGGRFVLSALLAMTVGCRKAPNPAPISASEPEAPQDVEPKIPAGVNSHVLHLMLSNQSAETNPIDFRVLIDEQQVWSGHAALEGGHNILEREIKLAEGNHVLAVETKNGKAQIRREIKLDGALYVDVAYWHHPRRLGAMTPKFTIRVEVSPFHPH